MYKHILYEKKERVLRITLNRPDRMNSLSIPLQEELVAALKVAENDNDIRCIILSGAGRTFCTGFDIEPTPERRERRLTMNLWTDTRYLEAAAARIRALRECVKPVIAQVHGWCLAGGTDVAFHCDMIICADDAQFGYPALRAQGGPVSHMWTQLLGTQWARRMLFTGDQMDGKTAERLGLVLKSVPAAQLASEVETLAARIALVPMQLLYTMKMACNRALEASGIKVVEAQAPLLDALGHLADERNQFYEIAESKGLREALLWRDGPFGDYSARVKKAAE